MNKLVLTIVALAILCLAVQAKLVTPKTAAEIPDEWFSPDYLPETKPAVQDGRVVAKTKISFHGSHKGAKTVESSGAESARFRGGPPHITSVTSPTSATSASPVSQKIPLFPFPGQNNPAGSPYGPGYGSSQGAGAFPPLLTSPAMAGGPIYEIPFHTYNINTLPQEVPPPTSNPPVGHFSDGSSYPINMEHYDDWVQH